MSLPNSAVFVVFVVVVFACLFVCQDFTAAAVGNESAS